MQTSGPPQVPISGFVGSMVWMVVVLLLNSARAEIPSTETNEWKLARSGNFDFPSLVVRCAVAAIALIITAASGGIRTKNLTSVAEVMGSLPHIDHHFPLDIRTLEEVRLQHYLRKKITFSAEPGGIVYAWLLIPYGVHKAPAALCLHQTTQIGKDEPAGLGGKPNLHYAEELAERGYVALAPDYPSFGDDKTDFQRDVYGRGYRSGSMKGIVNHIRAVDLLASLPEVDSRRISVIGHSLGGHNALFVAAFDKRIRAIVTSCGFTSMAYYNSGNLKGWTSDRYMPLISSVYHNSPKELPFDFSDILSAIAPRAVFVNAPLHDSNFAVEGVKECLAKVKNKFPGHRLEVEYPACGHDFPPDVRERAYRFLDRVLGPAAR
jgi:pimeloyl-ACP methyl ester carboxylesterase